MIITMVHENMYGQQRKKFIAGEIIHITSKCFVKSGNDTNGIENKPTPTSDEVTIMKSLSGLVLRFLHINACKSKTVET